MLATRPNNHLLPSAFQCLPLGSSGALGQKAGYDAAGNTLCSGQYGGASQAYVWDAESRLTQLWTEQNNNNYSLAATYVYDAVGNRVRANQILPGTSSTNTFREYSFFGGQMLAEKDQTGAWTDYVYANGKKIAKLPGTDNRIHSHGVFSKSGNELRWNLPQPLNANNTPYLVKTNDRLCLRQYQSNGLGGPVAFFSDNTSTAWNWSDTSGQTMNQLTTQNRWVYRCADLSMGGARTGTSVWIDLLTDVETPAGTWDIWYADMSVTSTDGTVTQLIGSQPPTPVYGDFQGNGNAWTVTPVAYPESVVPGSDPTGAASAGVVVSYYLTDHLGTTQMEFASGGWPVWKGEFAPFGQELDTQTTLNRYKFTGKERDTESGLDYFGARYYASSMGRWMSPDWADKPEAVPYSSLDNPQSLNLYGYVGNNPLSHADADGHCDANGQNCSAWDHIAGAVGGVLNIVPQSINLINSVGNAALSLTSTSYRIPMMDEIQSDAHASGVGMAGGQAAQLLVPVGDLAEGAQITRNALQGAAGEARVGAELVSEGKTIVGSQVGVQTDQGLRVVDHMVQDGGKLSAVEVKTGGATRNASQLAKDASMESNGGKIVGKNAPANLRGQTVKMPTEVRKPQP